MSEVFIDGSGWNGKRCGYAFATSDGLSKIEWFTEEKTNNEMEYYALIIALKEVAKVGDVIKSDSQLVVNQVNGKWRVKEQRLFSCCKIAQENIKKLSCVLTWIPREQNLAGHLLEK